MSFKTNPIVITPPWLSKIRSLQREDLTSDSSRWIQLATIGIDNTPRVRTVVFRGWSESYEMEIYTDIRSQKYHELALNNTVEICWLFSRSKCQFRFRGSSRIDMSENKLLHWEKLSERSKSMWSWPCPGDNFIFDKKNYLSLKKKEEVSNNFALIKIEITHVDQLLLHNPIHKRKRWILKEEWIEERINP